MVRSRQILRLASRAPDERAPLMRIAVGPYTATASDGTIVHVDQPLSTEQTDFLLAVIHRHGHCPHCTKAVEIDEASCRIIDPLADWPNVKRSRCNHPDPRFAA